jgi:hypothetical protein
MMKKDVPSFGTQQLKSMSIFVCWVALAVTQVTVTGMYRPY